MIFRIGVISGKIDICLDLEGKNLSRNGTIYIMQIFLPQASIVVLIDVLALGWKAFDTPGKTTQRTLRDILEHPNLSKYFFDCRSDSDALFAHYRIRLSGVKDIQVAKAAMFHDKNPYLESLEKTIQYQGRLSDQELEAFKKVKASGKEIFAGESPDRFDLWAKRPLEMFLVRYCIFDVVLLPRLWLNIVQMFGYIKMYNVEQATLKRVSSSQHPDYVPDGRHKSISKSSPNYCHAG